MAVHKNSMKLSKCFRLSILLYKKLHSHAFIHSFRISVTTINLVIRRVNHNIMNFLIIYLLIFNYLIFNNSQPVHFIVQL